MPHPSCFLFLHTLPLLNKSFFSLPLWFPPPRLQPLLLCLLSCHSSLQESPLTGFLLSVFHLVTVSNASYNSLIQISGEQAIQLESPPKGKKIFPASLVTLEIDQVALWSGWGGEERFAFMWAGWKGPM